MATKTNIGNLALLRIGVGQLLTDLDSDNSQAGLVLQTIYDDARLKVLRDFNWPFARKYGTLELVSGDEDTPANQDWIFAYEYPEDCVFARRIVGCEGRYDPSPPPFVVGRDDTGDDVRRIIYTNQGDADLEYTVNVEDAAEFEPTFVSMFAWHLAAQLAISLGRLPELAAASQKNYDSELAICMSRSVAEGEYAIPSGQTDPRVRDIFNLALTRIGINRNAASVDPELSFAILWPRLNFADERDFVLRDFPWPFATQYAVLELAVGDTSYPVNPDWVFAYRQPSDCLFGRRLVTTSGRKETMPPKFRIGRNPFYENSDTDLTVELTASAWTTADTITVTASSAIFSEDEVGNTITVTNGTDTAVITVAGYTSSTVVTGTPTATVAAGLRAADLYQWTRAYAGKCIYTDQECAQLEYTIQVTDPDEFDSAFISMLAWRIAATLAPGIASVAKDPGTVQRAAQMYEFEKSRAHRMALNEQQGEDPPDAEWVRNR